MKTIAILSLSSLLGLAMSPDFDPADTSVPCGRTDSVILTSGLEAAPVQFLGDDAASELDSYSTMLARAMLPQNPVPVPAPPASTLPSQGNTNCSAGTPTHGGATCSTDANQQTCSANGNGHNCSAATTGQAGQCSATTGGSENRCSIHAGNDAHCSAGNFGNAAGDAQCSAFDAGFCSVFGGGGAPGPNGPGQGGGQDNSCSAYGPNNESPKCSAFVTQGIPLCSVLKNKTNATCTVVDSEIGGAGSGAGTCSTMNAQGAPIGPPFLCSIIDLGPPVKITPPVNGKCTTTIPPPPPPPEEEEPVEGGTGGEGSGGEGTGGEGTGGEGTGGEETGGGGD